MGRTCAVPGCTRRKGKIMLHSFPKDHELANTWCRAIGRWDWANMQEVYKKKFVCDDHFSDSQTYPRNRKRTNLKVGAVPDMAVSECEEVKKEAVHWPGVLEIETTRPSCIVKVEATQDPWVTEDIGLSTNNKQPTRKTFVADSFGISSEMALKWGIVSAGKISHDFTGALKTHSAEKHQVVAVAARSYSSAKEFANIHGIPTAYKGYEALAKDANIDAVYIGVLNPQHLPVAKLMLDHGKHVLCEKPLTINKRETQELIDYAEAKELFLMEAIWSRCFPVYDKLRQIIEAGTIGDVLQVSVDFGFPLDHVDRVNVRELGGSAILDIGVYVLQFSQYVFKGLKPESILPWGHLNKNGTDDRAGVIITYPGGCFSVLSINACAQVSNTAHVYGTKGLITIPTFWCPNTMTIKPTDDSNISEETLKFDFPQSSVKYNYHNSVGLSYEAEEVRKCIQQGLLESPKVPHADSLELAELMDKMRKAAGTVFPQDI